MIPDSHFLILGAFLFTSGLLLILIKKNTILVLLGIEFMLNAANLNLIAFSRTDNVDLQGQVAVIFTMVVAAAEAAVALAILLYIYKYQKSPDLDRYNQLNG